MKAKPKENPPPPLLPIEERMLRVAEVAEFTGLAVRTIWRHVSAGKFPRPYNIGGASARWSGAEVAAWREAQKTARAA